MTDFRIGTVDDVIQAIQRARGPFKEDRGWGGILAFIGAGCSRSAGIPTAVEIAKLEVVELARRYSNGVATDAAADDALAWLKANKKFPNDIEWSSVYGELFDRHFKDSVEQQDVVFRAIAKAKGLNWAHVCLGELVKNQCIHTVLTTNFDYLALDALILAGVTPLVADGVESLQRITGVPTSPQLVHLHGSKHAYRPRNSSSDVGEVEASRTAGYAIPALLRASRGLLFVGYAGREEGIMKLLEASMKDWPGKTVYWVAYESNPDHVAPSVLRFLRASQGTLIPGQDADRFFSNLARGLGLGVPSWIKDPIVALHDRFKPILQPDGDAGVEEIIDEYSSHLDALRIAFNSHQASRSTLKKAVVHFAECVAAGRPRDAVMGLQDFRSQLTKRQQRLLADQAIQAGRNDADPTLTLLASDIYADLVKGGGAEKLSWAADMVGYARAQFELAGRDSRYSPSEAVRAGEAALGVYSSVHNPVEWAKTQNLLGNAHSTLAERTADGQEWQAAITAYEAALTVRTREQYPIEWAATLNNLAMVWRTLADQGGDFQDLHKAIAAHRSTLEVQTRERLPNEWAISQNNLGSALLLVGQRTKNPLVLHEAADAYRLAMEVHTRERVPLQWGGVQANLGLVLVALGEVTGDITQVEAAVAAMRASLEVRTRDRAPLPWAETQANLAWALARLGDKRSDPKALTEAISASRAALEVFTLESTPTQFERTNDHLRWSESVLEKLRSGGVAGAASEKALTTKQ